MKTPGLAIFCLFLICVSACQTDIKKPNFEEIFKEIPFEKNGDYVSVYKKAKAIANLLELDSLEVGYDSIQVRIWFCYGLLKKTHLIIILNQNSKWGGKFYDLMINAKAGKGYFLEKKTKNI